METKNVNVNTLKEAKYNPRELLQSGTKKYEQLKRSLKKFGVVVPIIINKDGTVISGHQRLNILKELNYEKVEVIELDLDETKEKQLNIALNKIEGRWDWQKLDEILESFTDDELLFTGFIDEETQKTAKREVKNTQKQATEVEKGFTIYISFGDKDFGNKWLKQHNIPTQFDDAESITINMEEI